jgi:murein DD-endopeptidase MepM/ murein hydrolase activator NlpD
MALIKRIFILLIIAVIVTGVIYFLNYIEWYKPEVTINLDSEYIGTEPVNVKITDKGMGLKHSVIKIQYADKTVNVKRKDYSDALKSDSFDFQLDTQTLTEGPAKLIIEAVDRSYLHFLHGNKTVFEKEVIIDTKPPVLEVVSPQEYLNHGGSGLVIYKTSSDTQSSGVVVDDYYFQGYNGYFKDENVYLCFFALPYNKSKDSSVFIIGVDKAGNSARNSFYHKIKPVNYRKSSINISESFILNKMQSLIEGEKPSDLKDIFLKVNSELRKKNDSAISQISKKSSNKILWKGRFHQLSRSKVEANFADERTYLFNEEPIDKQYHLGYDLAVTKRYPIEAANSGTVSYADNMGIYGKTVIIDHGMGISSLYGHMSSISVKVGDVVEKKQIIGKTGSTGLAAGDHLHYGVYIQGIAVRPVEWWDPKWLRDNIVVKMLDAQQEFGLNKSEPQN